MNHNKTNKAPMRKKKRPLGLKNLVSLDKKNVVIGKKNSYILPRGATHHGVLFELTNLSLSELTEFRLYLNGEVVIEYDTFAEINEIQRARGMEVVSDTGDIDSFYYSFDKMGLRSTRAERAYAIGTSLDGKFNEEYPIRQARIEFTIAPGATGADVDLYTNQSEPLPTGIFERVQRHIISNIRGGQVDFRGFSQAGREEPLHGIYFSDEANKITNIELWRNNSFIWDRNPAKNKVLTAQTPYAKNVESGFYMNFAEDGHSGGAISMKNSDDLYLRISVTNDVEITMYPQFTSTLDR